MRPSMSDCHSRFPGCTEYILELTRLSRCGVRGVRASRKPREQVECVGFVTQLRIMIVIAMTLRGRHVSAPRRCPDEGEDRARSSRTATQMD